MIVLMTPKWNGSAACKAGVAAGLTGGCSGAGYDSVPHQDAADLIQK